MHFLLRACTVQKKWWTVDLGLPPGADRVGGAGRLDLDDLGAHVAEQPARERPGDQRADLDDADPVQSAGGIAAPVSASRRPN